MSQQQESFQTGDVMIPDSSEAILRLFFQPYSFFFLAVLIFFAFEPYWQHIGIRTGRVSHEQGYELVTLLTMEAHYTRSKPGLVSRVKPRVYLRSIVWREFKRLW